MLRSIAAVLAAPSRGAPAANEPSWYPAVILLIGVGGVGGVATGAVLGRGAASDITD